MKRFKRKFSQLRESKGAITFPVLLISGAIFLAGLFFMVEMPLKLIMANQMVDTVNNAAASGVTQIVEAEVKHGRLHVDPNKATEAVHEVFMRTYNLDENLEPIGEDNILAKKPKITVQVVNKPHHASDVWRGIFEVPLTAEDVIKAKANKKTPQPIKLQVKETSVFVLADITFKRPIRAVDKELDLQRHAISEVKFPEYE